MRKIIFTFIMVLLGLQSAVVFAQNQVKAVASIQDVRIYFNGADLQHRVKVKLPKGKSQVLISNLSSSLNQNSIHIGSSKPVHILSTVFATNYDKAIKQGLTGNTLTDSIYTIGQELEHLSISTTSVSNALNILDANQTIPSGNGTNFSVELGNLVDFYTKKRTDLSLELNQKRQKKIELEQLLSSLQLRLEAGNELGSNYGKGQIIVQVESNIEQEVVFDLRYFTNTAQWFAAYDLNIKELNTPIQVNYKAGIKQNTGLDWNNLKLSLVSGFANQDNIKPVLDTWFIDYKENIVEEKEYFVGSSNAFARAKSVVSMPANNVLQPNVAISQKQMNIVFDIKSSSRILSDSKTHFVSLDTFELQANYQYYSAVKVDPNAYLVAKVNDYQDYNLLSGSANVIFEGFYIGSTFLDTNNTEQTLELNLGKDSQVQVSRRLISDKASNRVLSNRKNETLAYEILVKNNKKQSIDILIQDQIPVSKNTDIEVDLFKRDQAEVDAQKGILSWNLNVKANQVSKVDFSYTLKYNKEKALNN
ncbi:DUF4139 domain-containing protein [Myroides sp. LJL115]